MDINELPDFPSLKHLSDALHKKSTCKGAAILIGAGFSRNIETSSEFDSPPPLWSDLTHKLRDDLYGDDSENYKNISDLRLAEEYRTYFGQTKLNEFLRQHILDDQWKPNKLYTELLNLDWSEILTTNWDTLLERAAEDLNDKHYDIVRVQEDLVHAKPPRIVKLHGSLKTGSKLIFAEEDYRKYPDEYAAFVNFARQTFIENELCLLGFSGDDPNFLHWSGWVRDKLGDATRRIFLVGVLNLTVSKRKFLESRNIAPIDLYPMVKTYPKELQHQEATEKFLEFLSGQKPKNPREWKPKFPLFFRKLDNKTDDDVKELIKILKIDHDSYPNWLICPKKIRNSIRNGIDWHTLWSYFNHKIDSKLKQDIAYYLAWLLHLSNTEAPTEFIATLENAYEDPLKDDLFERKDFKFAAWMLEFSVKSGSEDIFKKWEKRIDASPYSNKDDIAHISFQKCIKAYRTFDLNEIAQHVCLIKGDDPIWLVRQTPFLMLIGRSSDAKNNIKQAKSDLQERLKLNRNSTYIISQLAWVSLPDKWFELEESQGSIHEAITHNQNEISNLQRAVLNERIEVERKSRKYQNVFSAGIYIDNINKNTCYTKAYPSENNLSSIYHTCFLAGFAPINLNRINFLNRALQDTIDINFKYDLPDYLLLISTLRHDSNDFLEKIFSRINIAKLSIRNLDSLKETILQSIHLFLGTNTEDLETFLDNLISVYARLTIRLNIDNAEASLILASKLATNSKYIDGKTYEGLKLLIANVIEILIQKKTHICINWILDFPLPSQVNVKINYAHKWPNPIEKIDFSDLNIKASDISTVSISRLIDAVKANNIDRPQAISRLLILKINNLLDRDYLQSFITHLWEHRDVNSLPANCNLWKPYLLNLLPEHQSKLKSLIEATLYKSGENIFSNNSKEWNTSLKEDASAGIQKIYPKPKIARKMLDAFIDWHNKKVEHSIIDISINKEKSFKIAKVISYCLAPTLYNKKDKIESLKKIMMFLENPNYHTTLSALPYFWDTTEKQNEQIIAKIKDALLSSDPQTVRSATNAVLIFLDLEIELPAELRKIILQAFIWKYHGNLSSLAFVTNKILDQNKFKKDEMSKIAEIIDFLWFELAYANISHGNFLEISVSLIRQDFVRMAYTLKKEGFSNKGIEDCLAEYQNDPLPEVRYALQTSSQ